MKKIIIIFSVVLISISALSQTPWYLSGNAGTNPPTDFLGTTDNNPFVFKVNNQLAGYSGFSGSTNVSFGYLSLQNPFPGNGGDNTAFGAQALQNNTNGINAKLIINN
jgi:hypothetical protein